MAYTIGSVRGEFDPNVVDGSSINAFKAALGDDPEGATAIAGRATFKVDVTSDTTTTATAVMSLTDLGVTVPDGHCRMVKARGYFRDDDQSVLVENSFILTGGTNTPSVAAATAANTTVLAGGLGTTTTPANPTLTMGVNTTPSPDEVELRMTLPATLGTGATVKGHIECTVEPLVVLAAGASTTA